MGALQRRAEGGATAARATRGRRGRKGRKREKEEPFVSEMSEDGEGVIVDVGGERKKTD